MQNPNQINKFFIPALTIAFITTWVNEALTGIYLLGITQTYFQNPPLTAPGSSPLLTAGSQLVTLSTLAAVTFGILLSALSVKFNHKKLLLFGITAIAVGTVGCILSPNWLAIQIFFPVETIGTVIVTAMTFTLLGENLPLHRRPRATGYILAGAPVASIAAALIISAFFSTELEVSTAVLPISFATTGWRNFLLLFAVPATLTALVAVYLGVPKTIQNPLIPTKTDLKASFKAVFLRRSSVGCLIGNMIRQAAMVWRVVYIPTFFRETFYVNSLTLSQWTLLLLGTTVIGGLGSIAGGHLIKRVGRKRLLIASLIVSSPFILPVAFWSNPNLLIILPLSLAGVFFFNMGFPSSINLTLEQAPQARGTMMSINTIFVMIGVTIGTVLGGLVLKTTESYTALILAFIALQLTAAAIYFFLTKDPYEFSAPHEKQR